MGGRVLAGDIGKTERMGLDETQRWWSRIVSLLERQGLVDSFACFTLSSGPRMILQHKYAGAHHQFAF
jgi:hypothetical protein